jgi:uncharacterized protein YggE
MKLVRLALLGVGIAAVVAFAGVGLPARAHGDTNPTRSITVSGSGSVTTTPAQSTMTFGVSTKSKTAVQALAENATAMRKLIDALKAAGVGAASLQTQSVSLSPVTSDDGQTILGYTASNSVAATIGVGRVGQIIDAAVAAGANEVDGPSLSVPDQTSLYHEALKAAVADARAKAQVLADAGGLHVGAVTSVEESGDESPITYDAAKALPATGTPVEPGTSQVTASVTVVFEAS